MALKLPAPTAGQRGGTASSAAPFESGGGFEAILGQIGDHPGGQGFHLPIIRAVASFVATNGADIDIETLFDAVRARILAADRSSHDDRYVEHVASREQIVPEIARAIAKFGHKSPARHKPRQIPGVPPHFTGRALSADAASALLKEEIRSFFGP